MDLETVTLLFAVLIRVGESYKCTDHPAPIIEVIGLSTDFRFEKAENFSESKLKVVYEWDVIDSITRNPVKTGFDGFAYKFTAREEHHYLDISFYNTLHDYNENACDNTTGTVWLRGMNKPCQLPCRGTTPTVCEDGDVCAMLTMGYTTVPWNTTRLEFPVEFGRIYDIHVIPYNNWMAGRGQVADGVKTVRFCKDELIRRHNVTHERAHDYCDSVSMFNGREIQDRMIYSGPVSHFEKYDVTVDFSKNRAKVSFRWKRPYDYHPNATLQKYLVALDRSRPRVQNLSKSGYDVITIDDVTIGQSRILLVVPVLYIDYDHNKTLVVHGAVLSETFEIKDFDACSEGNGVGGRYCDGAANCTDLSIDANASAICACTNEFVGNGISNKWPEGNGCTDPSHRTSSIVVGISCAIVIFVVLMLIGICIKSRNSVRRKILREEEY